MLTQSSVPDIDAVEARLREMVSLHFDPKWGSAYWLDRARMLGFDPRHELRTLNDLHRFGLTEPAALGERPLDEFVPAALKDHREKLIVAQTGGTLGRPAWTAYLEDEFEQAFVEPFAIAAQHVGFPTSATWLYAGPSGPHVIGRAADAIARRLGSSTPFMVDFDPRWARKLAAGSFAAERYQQHVVDQALAVIQSQEIGVLFTTPIVLRALANGMTDEQRKRIRGVHYGGIELSPEQLARFQCEDFPNAVHLSGYGNTLFGCCLELSAASGRALRYYPYGDRLVLGAIRENDPSAGGLAQAYDSPSSEGRLVFARLDRSLLLLNVLERDRVRLVAPPPGAPRGFSLRGVESPTPLRDRAEKPMIGLY